MALDIDFHNLREIHNLEVILKYERTIDDDEFIAYDDNQMVIVPHHPECELHKSIVYKEEYDRKKNIDNDIII